MTRRTGHTQRRLAAVDVPEHAQVDVEDVALRHVGDDVARGIKIPHLPQKSTGFHWPALCSGPLKALSIVSSSLL